MQLFIIHPLVFYIKLSNDWSRANDGEFIFSIGDNYKISSIPFFILGMITDLVVYILVSKKGTFIN